MSMHHSLFEAIPADVQAQAELDEAKRSFGLALHEGLLFESSVKAEALWLEDLSDTHERSTCVVSTPEHIAGRVPILELVVNDYFHESRERSRVVSRYIHLGRSATYDVHGSVTIDGEGMHEGEGFVRIMPAITPYSRRSMIAGSTIASNIHTFSGIAGVAEVPPQRDLAQQQLSIGAVQDSFGRLLEILPDFVITPL